jgi:hypothetical protein
VYIEMVHYKLIYTLKCVMKLLEFGVHVQHIYDYNLFLRKINFVVLMFDHFCRYKIFILQNQIRTLATMQEPLVKSS